jgi:hypothetical protein
MEIDNSEDELDIITTKKTNSQLSAMAEADLKSTVRN